ncbi:hypothetical protein AWM79_13750 [Pseudomonas agarici]|uniref:DUF4238 domain-containing protein n=1 Tax=Pseudomonas agarici TaxID=46677 RepID=A0A0X1T380_PSEAA|nr:hypothetical protein AWM79_13750 [Pseudomonas agarici]
MVDKGTDVEDKKSQYFVPQYYFRFFSNDKKFIPLLRLTDGKVVPAASIRDQASKSYFYGDKKIEERISELENLFLPELKKLKDTKFFDQFSLE